VLLNYFLKWYLVLAYSFEGSKGIVSLKGDWGFVGGFPRYTTASSALPYSKGIILTCSDFSTLLDRLYANGHDSS
jgi:hypothetical protein